MNKLIFILALFTISITSFAQKNDYIWLMGYSYNTPAPGFGGTIIDFNIDPPNIYNQDRDMNIDITLASYCHDNGELFAYTNGIYLANSVHEPMENGNNLNPGMIASESSFGGYRVFQSEFFLPSIENENLLNLYHSKLDYHDSLVIAVTTFFQSTIDQSLQGELGQVIEKNK